MDKFHGISVGNQLDIVLRFECIVYLKKIFLSFNLRNIIFIFIECRMGMQIKILPLVLKNLKPGIHHLLTESYSNSMIPTEMDS